MWVGTGTRLQTRKFPANSDQERICQLYIHMIVNVVVTKIIAAYILQQIQSQLR